jgi:DNA repair protein RecN (Recombination protein N)
MLSTLRIKNLALVADLTLDLEPGFNAITGETGAGKSIIIGALNLVLGQRADRTMIRTGCDGCTVEAAFDLGHRSSLIDAFLAEHGLEPGDHHQLLLKRVFNATGANRQFINGSPATLNILAELGEWLVDIHGPHDHQSLLHCSRQLDILDAFGKLEFTRESYGALARQRLDLERQKQALIIDERTYAQQLDLLRFQVNEIAAAQLRADEESSLQQEHQRASNAAKLLQLSQAARSMTSEDDASLLNRAGVLGRTLQELQRIDTSASSLVELHVQLMTNLQELQKAMSHYADRLEQDPSRLEELEERLNLIHSLKRKYGSTLAEVIQFGEVARQKLCQLEQRETELARLQTEMQRLDLELWKQGQELSARRRKLIPQLARSVTRQLADLGFKQSHFEITINTLAQAEFRPATLTSTGLDAVEFLFAPNPGEPSKPLRAIASSGEIARVMLALKTVLAAEDAVPVLVFDEVDANIGGETALVVGDKMRQIGKSHQVLCVTHLAPVAAGADTHFLVVKEVKDGRTLSEISRLKDNERIEELARMLGGQSSAARRHAAALLESASKP